MICLVTGGAGFIGSHLVDALVARGDSVAVLDDLSTGRRENLTGALQHGAALHAADVRDAAAVEAVFARVAPEIVFHLAAQVDVRHSVESPRDDAISNVLGTINILEAARSSGSRRVVYTSTGGGLYGEADVFPTPEDIRVKPLAQYGQGKYAAEGYCEVYSRLYGLSTVSLRYANVYGPRQNPHGEAGVVAIFSGCFLEGRQPLVFGDGRQTRDWVEVSDVVRANLLAAQAELTGPVNIGTATETSVLDLIERLNQLGGPGRQLEPQFAPARAGEVMRSCLDIARARRDLGWEPEVDLATGLARLLGAA